MEWNASLLLVKHWKLFVYPELEEVTYGAKEIEVIYILPTQFQLLPAICFDEVINWGYCTKKHVYTVRVRESREVTE